MGRLISIIGNTGVGKTSLLRALSAEGGFSAGLEEHQERPFQALFKADPCHALANQVDYLVLRAEQEDLIRKDALDGIQDGGIEMDLHIFCHLFYHKGWLSLEELNLLHRLVAQFRHNLPPPELFIYMQASPAVICERFTQRKRPLEISTAEDITIIQGLLDAWLPQIQPDRLICVDASRYDPGYTQLVPTLLEEIHARLGEPASSSA